MKVRAKDKRPRKRWSWWGNERTRDRRRREEEKMCDAEDIK